MSLTSRARPDESEKRLDELAREVSRLSVVAAPTQESFDHPELVTFVERAVRVTPQAGFNEAIEARVESLRREAASRADVQHFSVLDRLSSVRIESERLLTRHEVTRKELEAEAAVAEELRRVAASRLRGVPLSTDRPDLGQPGATPAAVNDAEAVVRRSKWARYGFSFFLALAASVHVLFLREILASVLRDVSATAIWVGTFGFATVALNLMHSAGRSAKGDRLHGRRPVTSVVVWLCGTSWVALGIVPYLASAASGVSPAIWFATLYVPTGVLVAIGSYASYNPHAVAYERATATMAQALALLPRILALQARARQLVDRVDRSIEAVKDRAQADHDALSMAMADYIARARRLFDELRAGRAELVAMVRMAWDQAGRALSQSNTSELFESRGGMVWIPEGPALTVEDVHRARRYLSEWRTTFVVHRRAPAAETEHLLDELRLQGYSIVLVRADSVRAALTDGRAAALLDEMEASVRATDVLFETKNALIDERQLFGRDALLTTMGVAINNDEHLLITGVRKVGKTSLLNIVRQHFSAQPVCLIDLQKFNRHTEEWPLMVFQLMIEAFDSWGRIDDANWPFSPSSPGTATALTEALDARIAYCGASRGVRLIVILDEIERIFPTRGEELEAKRWVQALGALRSLCQGDRRRIVIVGADLRPTANRTNDLGPAGTNPVFSFFQELPVPMLTAEATQTMLTSLLRIVDAPCATQDFHRRVFDLSGGHPLLSRMAAGAAYRHHSGGRPLDAASVDHGLADLTEAAKVSAFLRGNLWEKMTDPERAAVTSWVAGTPPQPSAGLSRYDLDQAIAALTGQGVLGESGVRPALLTRWVRAYGTERDQT